MINTNDKYPIFEHVIDSYLYIAGQSGFKYGNNDNKYVISGYPSANFNFLYLSKQDGLLEKTVSDNIQFICFPQKELEDGFAQIAQNNGLIAVDNVVAYRFDIDNNWNYKPSSSIEVVKIENDKELVLFDQISSECFVHTKGLAYDFLRKVAIENKKFELFLAYKDEIPIGTVMISFVNDIAGIYWLSVLPDYRNKGVATELTNYMINLVKEKGHICLISQNLTPSQSLFQRIGFKPYGALPLYVSSGKND